MWLAAGERARLGLWLPGEREFGDEGGAHVHFALAAACFERGEGRDEGVDALSDDASGRSASS